MASRNLVANGSGGRKGGVSDFVQFDDETILWTASLILLKHLQRPELRQQLRGKRVLELGSGLGHLGLGMAALGAHVTCTERPQELPHLEANLAKHAATREQQQGGAGALSILDEALLLLRPPEAAADEGTKQPAAGQGTTEAQSAQEAASATSGGGEALQGSVQAVALEWGQDGFSRCGGDTRWRIVVPWCSVWCRGGQGMQPPPRRISRHPPSPPGFNRNRHLAGRRWARSSCRRST